MAALIARVDEPLAAIRTAVSRKPLTILRTGFLHSRRLIPLSCRDTSPFRMLVGLSRLFSGCQGT